MQKKLRVAATGISGLIGSRIEELLYDKFEFISLSQDTFDITDMESVGETISSIDFDFFLHLAAYTHVDHAEIEKELCRKINVIGTQNVLNAVVKKNRKFIYFSTGFVFDGNNPPYYEDSLINAVGYYGKTKAEGETFVHNKGMIIRIDTPYRANFEIKKDFVRTIQTLLKEKRTLSMVTDSLITPTYIDDIAASLDYLINNYSPEIFHITGADALSPYDAGQLIAKTLNLDHSGILPATFKDYFKDKAPRPQFLDMKTKNNNFFRMKTFEEGLKEISRQI